MLALVLSPAPSLSQSRLEIQLQPDLVLGDERGAVFGDGLRLAVNSKGAIYVADGSTSSIVVFAASGVPIDTIGRRGRGPGEFTTVHALVVGRGDSVFVFDANTQRLTVFSIRGTKHAFAYSLTAMPSNFGRAYRALIPNGAGAGYLLVYRQMTVGTISVHEVSRDGEVDSRALLTGKAAESRVNVRQADGATEVVRAAPLFGRSEVLGITSADEIFYGWTDVIDLTFYDLVGRVQSIFRSDSRPIPVTARDIAFELEGADDARRRVIAGAEHAQTKPALHSVIIDDESRIWTGRYTSDPNRHEWWVTLDHGRGQTAVFTLPSTINLQVVRNGFAYAVAVDADGAPTVVRYRVTIQVKGAR